MEGMEGEAEASLPPGYVSLAQLQERWLKKQQEKKLNDKREEEEKLNEKREEERRNGGRGKMGGGSVRDAKGKNGLKKGVIDEKGKGKEIVIGGFESGAENKKGLRGRHSGKTKSAGDDGKGKDRIEIKEGEIVDGELKGIKEIASVCMVEVLPRNGVKGGFPDVKRADFRGGFGRNGDSRGRIIDLKQREGRLGFGKKMEGERGYGKKWEERERESRRGRGRKNDGYQERYNRFRESRNDVFKGNGVEPESEKKEEDEVLDIFSGKCGLSEGNGNGNKEENKTQGKGLSDDRVAPEKKVDEVVLAVESAENGEKGGVGRGYNVGRGYSGHRKSRGNGGEGSRYPRLERFDGRPKMEHREGERGYGKKWEERERESRSRSRRGRGRKNDGYQERYNRFRESKNDVFKGNGVEPESEKKEDDEVLDIFSGKCGLSEGDGNGNKEENKIQGEGLSDDRVAPEKKVDDVVLAVESAENGEKGGVGRGYNVGRGYSGHRKSRGNGGEGSRYPRLERFDDRPKMEHREGRMIWVKKDETWGAHAAEIGSSGVRVDQEY